MEKFELLKNMIADISNDEKYRKTVFETDDLVFVIRGGEIFAIDAEEMPDYFIHEYSKEEFEYVQRIERELDLDYDVFLPLKGDVVICLEDLIECYEVEDEEENEDKIEQIEKLIDVINDEKSVFYKREQEFLSIFLNRELESGVAYVHNDWDHDESYYYGLDYSIGVYDPLYDVIANEFEFVYPDDFEEQNEEECDRWIEILSEIDKYVVK